MFCSLVQLEVLEPHWEMATFRCHGSPWPTRMGSALGHHLWMLLFAEMHMLFFFPLSVLKRIYHYYVFLIRLLKQMEG